MWRAGHRKPHTSETIRAIIRSNLGSKLAKKCEESKREGRLPFEGGWYSRVEIILGREELKRRDRELVVGMIAVLGVGAAFVGLLFMVLLVLV